MHYYTLSAAKSVAAHAARLRTGARELVAPSTAMVSGAFFVEVWPALRLMGHVDALLQQGKRTRACRSRSTFCGRSVPAQSRALLSTLLGASPPALPAKLLHRPPQPCFCGVCRAGVAGGS